MVGARVIKALGLIGWKWEFGGWTSFLGGLFEWVEFLTDLDIFVTDTPAGDSTGTSLLGDLYHLVAVSGGYKISIFW